MHYPLGNLTNDGRKGLVISYNVLNLPRSVATAASGSLTYTYLSDGTKVSAIKSDGSGERYLGSFVYSVPSSGSETLESAAWDEGRIGFVKTGNSYTKSDLWFVNDHLGNVRTVVDISTGLSAPQVLERNDYLPFGTRLDAGTAVIAGNRFRLGGKESQTFGSLDLGKVDFGARMYDPFTARWTTADPLAAKYGNMSPYNYCGGNPIVFSDLRGMSPIYSSDGEFLGTDDEGLKGLYIIMDASLFSQGMTHEDSLSNSLIGPIDKQVRTRVKQHFRSLKSRLDYDGVISISEGIAWAKTHLGAKDNPTPDNMLYADASKLDFGGLTTEYLKEGSISSINLYNFYNLPSATKVDARSTIYALGLCSIKLHDNRGTVSVINDKATDYDWNRGGSFLRDKTILFEKWRAIIPDDAGFKVYYYGRGIVKTKPSINR